MMRIVAAASIGIFAALAIAAANAGDTIMVRDHTEVVPHGRALVIAKAIDFDAENLRLVEAAA